MLYSLEKEKFGEYIKKIRKSLNITQMEVSKKTTLSCETLRRIEKGENLPTLRTIEDLTTVYKFDVLKLYMSSRQSNSLFSFYEYLDDLIINYDKNKLKNISSIFNNLLVYTDKLFNEREGLQLHAIVKGLELSYKKFGSKEALNMYLEAINITISGFQIINIKNYKYSYLEIKCLLLISLEYNALGKFEISNQLSLFLFNNYNIPSENFTNTTLLKIKLLMNISYNFHCLDKHQLSHKYSNMGIEYCKSNKTNYLLYGLFYRRGISAFLSGFPEYQYMSDLRKAIMLLNIYDMKELQNVYINVTKEKYNLTITL